MKEATNIVQRKEMIDVENFTRHVNPRKNGSQLLRFLNEIGDLKRRNYSDELIREWLSRNGITVSRENVRKFIKRHLRELDTKTQSAEENDATTAAEGDQAQQFSSRIISDASQDNPKESTAQRIQRLARQQRNEAERNQFQHDKTGNNY